MTHYRSLRWPLIIGLGVFALIRPLYRILESHLDFDGTRAVPIALTVAISIVWILVVGLSRTPEPVITLVFAGLTYGVTSIALSGILSPILDGKLDGPLANPIGIVPALAVNAVWGLIAGGLAQLLQRSRRVRPTAGPRGR